MATNYVATNLQTQAYRTEVRRGYTVAQRIAHVEKVIAEREAAGLPVTSWRETLEQIKAEANQ